MIREFGKLRALGFGLLGVWCFRVWGEVGRAGVAVTLKTDFTHAESRPNIHQVRGLAGIPQAYKKGHVEIGAMWSFPKFGGLCLRLSACLLGSPTVARVTVELVSQTNSTQALLSLLPLLIRLHCDHCCGQDCCFRHRLLRYEQY